MTIELMPIPILIIAFLILVLVSIRQINQYERGVKLTFGKFSGIMQPGWRIVWPVIQKMYRADMRIQVVDVPSQESLTRDNIPVGVNAVVYFKVVDAEKALLNVQYYAYASQQLAQTTLRNAVGEVTLDKLLTDRDDIAENIKKIVGSNTQEWGIEMIKIELKDIVIPENLKRTIMKAAEAERERQAVIIQSQGEIEAAKNISQAAEILAQHPGGLHIRTLSAINDLSSDQSNTTVWMLPIEVLHAVEGIAHMTKGSKK